MRQRCPHFHPQRRQHLRRWPHQESVTAENGQLGPTSSHPKCRKWPKPDEFRGRYRYNLLDENVRRFNAEVPQIWQWDDHEVTNNWSDAKDLGRPATPKNVPLLTARGTRPSSTTRPCARSMPASPGKVYRQFCYGPLLEVRAGHALLPWPNSANLRPKPATPPPSWAVNNSTGSARELSNSRAVESRGCRHAPGPERGRWQRRHRPSPLGSRGQRQQWCPGICELEFAELLRHLKRTRCAMWCG